MKKPRKPKLKKLPKKPRKSASIETWHRWEQRAKPVIAENKRRMADYKKALKKWEAANREKERLARLEAY